MCRPVLAGPEAWLPTFPGTVRAHAPPVWNLSSLKRREEDELRSSETGGMVLAQRVPWGQRRPTRARTLWNRGAVRGWMALTLEDLRVLKTT